MLKFTKEGMLKYTSHLDMVRMFKRAFSRADLRLAFSEGFNPHPKMSFAQPLSLGYSSIAEWLEFETLEDFEPEDLMTRLAPQLPDGMRLLEASRMSREEKSLASRCAAAEYLIVLPLDESVGGDGEALARTLSEDCGNGFLEQAEIPVLKKSKKGAPTTVDIRGMIRWLRIDVVDTNIIMSTCLDAGSQSNLSPELLIRAFQDYYGLAIPRDRIDVLRTDLEM
jgi:radical SAM-linked protein